MAVYKEQRGRSPPEFREREMSNTEFQPAPMQVDHSTDGGARIGKTAARQGVALGSVRYVLGISLALALVAFVVLYFLYM